MRTLALLAVVFAQAQDKYPVRLVAGAPDEKGWPISGAIEKPNETIVSISVVRVERRWDLNAKRFNEQHPPETRVTKSAEVEGKAFKVAIPGMNGYKTTPVGLFKLVVTERGKPGEIHVERAIRGRPLDLFRATGKQVESLLEILGRLTQYVDLLEQVSRDKKLSTIQRHNQFTKSVKDDDDLIKKSAEIVDLTATLALMRECVSLILSAQVWPRPDNDAAQNDGDQIFVDPAMSFDSLRAVIASTRTVISAELRASTAMILEEMFRRAKDRPALLSGTSGAKDAAKAAAKNVKEAPVEDKAFDELLEQAEKANEASIPEVLESLQAAVKSLVTQQN